MRNSCAVYAVGNTLSQKNADGKWREGKDPVAGEKQFEERKEQIDLINRKCHDLKHQIAALEFISDKKEYEQSIREMKDAVQMYDEDLHTGNLALETIIKEKNCNTTKNGLY